MASLSSENLPEALQLCPEPILLEAGKNSSEGVLGGRGGKRRGKRAPEQ